MSDDLDPIRMVNEGAWIRVYDFQGTPHAEGRVIAYCDKPTILIEGANGERTHCSVGMRRERVPPPPPPEPPVVPRAEVGEGYRQPLLTFDFAMDNARRLLQWAEQQTDRQLMAQYMSFADSWISIAGLAHQRERGELG